MNKFATKILIIGVVAVIASTSAIFLFARFNLTGETLGIARVGGFASEISTLRKNRSTLSVEVLKKIPRNRLQDDFVVKSNYLIPPVESFGTVVVEGNFATGRVFCVGRDTDLGYLITSDGEIRKIKKSQIQRVIDESFTWRAWLLNS